MSVHLKTRNINILIKGEKLHLRLNKMVDNNTPSGANPGFQVRGGAHIEKLRPAEGGAKIVGVFGVKNHEFTPGSQIFFYNFRLDARRVRPLPLDLPL